jgi:enolase-phosphatase E1
VITLQVSLFHGRQGIVTDPVVEVRAAKIAGMESLVVDRPGNVPLTEEDKNAFTVITSFDEIDLD